MSYLEDDNNLNEIPKIKVIIRKRSLNMKEIEQNETDIIEIKDKKTLILKETKITLDLSKTIENHTFTFDKVYDENSTNEKIYLETVRPMIKCAFFKKAKISVFCYGQTGSGKTYTMMGNLNKNNLNFTPGLYSFAAYDIFQIINYPQFENYYLTCSFYEIYCGKLYDLLNNRNILNIREDGKQNINIIGLTEKYIEDFNDLINLIDLGLKNRTIGTTKVNNNSSRSHGIIQINILDSYDNINGKISFIDLAGSERESDKEMNLNKQTRIDGAEINKSLLALKECIRALELDKKHLPFRGSKLTLVLRDSFIGNCKTLMIANISPSSNSADHTLNTLRYADRVKELKKSRTPKKNNNNRNTINFDTKEFIANLIGDNNKKVNNNNNKEEFNQLNKSFIVENKENLFINNINNYNAISNKKNNDKDFINKMNFSSPININSKSYSNSTNQVNKINKKKFILNNKEDELESLENKHNIILNELLLIEDNCVDQHAQNIIQLGEILNQEIQIIQNYKNGNVNIKEYIELMKQLIQSKIIKLKSMAMNFNKFNTKIEQEEKISENIEKIKQQINEESQNSFCLLKHFGINDSNNISVNNNINENK
jgi:kinesin family protein 2/24